MHAIILLFIFAICMVHLIVACKKKKVKAKPNVEKPPPPPPSKNGGTASSADVPDMVPKKDLKPKKENDEEMVARESNDNETINETPSQWEPVKKT